MKIFDKITRFQIHASEDELTIILNALRIASSVYQRDSEITSEQERISKDFTCQAKDCDALVEQIQVFIP